MLERQSPLRRLAVTWAAVSGLSVAGHVLGGGTAPSPVALILVGILALTCTALVCRGDAPVRTPVATVLIGGLQLTGHLVFHHVGGGGPVSAWATHGHHPVPMSSGAATGAAAAHGVDPLMVTSHLLATVLLAWLLCGHARTFVTAVLRRLLPPLPAATARPVADFAGHSPTWISREVDAGLLLRGPPRVCHH